MNWPKGKVADAEYEEWRANWTPPAQPISALPGFAIVEFGPIANRGPIICPNGVSYNAMIVSDGNTLRASREGFLPVGTEIVYLGDGAVPLEVLGRTLHRVPRRQIEIYIPKEEAV